MLISLKKLDPDKRAECLQNGWIALDPKTRVTLRRAPEEFPLGSRIKYYI
jgi:hypothetical protein